jgi:hypothetical protein
MMSKRALLASVLAVCCLITPATLFAQGKFVEVYIAKVKPEKAFEAESLARKIADANRRNNGDHVIAMETVYGEGYTYVFASQRQDYADSDKAGEVFMSSLSKAFGKQGAEKLLADWSNCLISSRSELRVRRPDLSSKAPKDPESFAKLVGESRVIRSLALHVRPGHVADFETLLKDINARADRRSDTQPVLVSQVAEGTHGDTYYITFFRTSLGGFDKDVMLSEILGQEGMAKLEKIAAEAVLGEESAIYRFRPDMSFPPDAIAQASADFWNPKPAMSATAKPKAKTPSGADVTPAAKSAEKP